MRAMDKGLISVQSLTVAILLLLLCAGQASASFRSCFGGCALDCIFRSHKILCVIDCLGECLLGVGSSELDYCKLGCAVDQCSHFANDFTMEDVDKVDNCVNECEIGQCSFLTEAMTLYSQKQTPIGAPSPR